MQITYTMCTQAPGLKALSPQLTSEARWLQGGHKVRPTQTLHSQCEREAFPQNLNLSAPTGGIPASEGGPELQKSFGPNPKNP